MFLPLSFLCEGGFEFLGLGVVFGIEKYFYFVYCGNFCYLCSPRFLRGVFGERGREGLSGIRFRIYIPLFWGLRYTKPVFRREPGSVEFFTVFDHVAQCTVLSFLGSCGILTEQTSQFYFISRVILGITFYLFSTMESLILAQDER